jgi:hypothetical protein
MWYRENERLFASRLVRPSLQIHNLEAQGFSGLWFYDHANKNRETIQLCPNHGHTKKWLHIVLVHEMIHQFQAIQKSQRTIDEQHGRFFQQHICRIIRLDNKLFNLILTVPKWNKQK